MSNKRFNNRNRKPEFDQKLLDLARVVRVVKGGRRFSFRATMIIGNRKGKVGLGVSQGKDVAGAINKAVETAKKSMIIVKRLDSTISYRIDEKFCGAQIMIKPAKDGKGIVAGGAMRLIFELAGIRNITAKSLGSSNKINIAKATLKALDKLEGKKNSRDDKPTKSFKAVKTEKTPVNKVEVKIAKTLKKVVKKPVVKIEKKVEAKKPAKKKTIKK